MGTNTDHGRAIQGSLELALATATAMPCPPRLAAALRHAVFPGGARIRPRLCLSVADACGVDRPEIADGAATALELLHCASLVHDDLPAFDDAATRRGRPSVHLAFGEPVAILAGDALIVLAFEVLGRTIRFAPDRAAQLIAFVAAAVGGPSGIAAGQAWECEPEIDPVAYHQAKTGSLFVAAATCGAIAAGADPEPWRAFGSCLGEAYQVADDIHDAAADAGDIGKPVGRDAALGRPNAVARLGLDGAIDRLDHLVANSIAAIPACPGAAPLRALVEWQAQRFVPKNLVRRAA